MVQAPVRTRAPIAEKYVNMRTQSFTRTHARAMQQWLDGGRGTEEEYFAWFRKEVERSARRWEADCAAIDRDQNLSFREKREEKNKLNRVYPAWTLEQEERFIELWGDPRQVDRSRLESLLTDLESPQWDNALREGQIRSVPKKEWERKFHEAIMNPQDGSVPLFLAAAEVRTFDRGLETPEIPLVLDTPNYQTPEVPEVDPPEIGGAYLTDQQKAEFQAHVIQMAKRTCPLCRVYFPRGLKPQHVGSAGCKSQQEANTK